MKLTEAVLSFEGLNPVSAFTPNVPNITATSIDALGMIKADARNIKSVIGNHRVNLTLTSPPYFDLKDYGNKSQIGFGQDYSTYLRDLTAVFKAIFEATDDTGSLWIVIDSFRRNGELVPLPFDLATNLKKVGWQLKDVIIWKKERTLPWLHAGATRNIFEYVMVFAKCPNKMKYYPDRVRDHVDLKSWWVKYPERYNPKGKSLEEVWTIDIPVQGSWGKKTPRHFCPLPPALVRRVLRLTTDDHDLVLDPFAGTGTVLSEAITLGRRSVGCEINSSLVRAYRARSARATAKPTRGHDNQSNEADQPNCFEQTIIDLRILKFGRLLLKQVKKEIGIKEASIFVSRSRRKPTARHAITSADYLIIFEKQKRLASRVLSVAQEAASQKPLSKFGIDAVIEATCDLSRLRAALPKRGKLYCYSITNTNKYINVAAVTKINYQNISPIISPIVIKINEPSD